MPSSVNLLFLTDSSLRFRSHLSRNHWSKEGGQVRTMQVPCAALGRPVPDFKLRLSNEIFKICHHLSMDTLRGFACTT